jgi:hypothetical protein
MPDPLKGLKGVNIPMSTSAYPEDDAQGQMQLALEHLKVENPDLASNYASMSTMWPRDPTVAARTFPITRDISYNPDVIRSRDQQYADDTLAHELVHTRQMKQAGPLAGLMSVLRPPSYTNLPHDQRPIEQEANAEEARRQGYRRDIPLIKGK